MEHAMKSLALAVLAVFLASSAYAAEKHSEVFIKKAIEGNFAEVEMGKLAQQKGQNDDVKKFGQKTSSRYADHGNTTWLRFPSCLQRTSEAG
jgi:predicted outer membrane protein